MVIDHDIIDTDSNVSREIIGMVFMPSGMNLICGIHGMGIAIARFMP